MHNSKHFSSCALSKGDEHTICGVHRLEGLVPMQEKDGKWGPINIEKISRLISQLVAKKNLSAVNFGEVSFPDPTAGGFCQQGAGKMRGSKLLNMQDGE